MKELRINTTNSLVAEAMKYYGMKEVKGYKAHPEILRIIQTSFPYAKDDSHIAWCSIFLNEVARQAGYEASRSAMAKSWLKIGQPVIWEDRRAGDVVVFNRTRDPRFGHVAIYLNDRSDSSIRVLGGNQQDAINVRSYAISRIAGIRRLRRKDSVLTEGKPS